MTHRDRDGNLHILMQRAGDVPYTDLHEFIGWVCMFTGPEHENVAVLTGVQHDINSKWLVFRFADGMSFRVMYHEMFELVGYR